MSERYGIKLIKAKMKKIASLFLLVVISLSCTTDVTKNDPAFEGLKDDFRWRAKSMYAELTPNQHIKLIGITQYETLTLTTTNKIPLTYNLGLDDGVTATFEDSDSGVTYSTGAGFGDGIIVIKEFDEIQMTISGEFRFNAINTEDNPAGGPMLNFQHGVFYKVPVIPSL